VLDGGQGRALDVFDSAQTAAPGLFMMKTDVQHKSRSNRELTHCRRRFVMIVRNTLAAAAAAALFITAGCAVTRGQESVGAYVDDTAITTAVKGRFVDNKDVDASSISVETLNGTVMLAGFAKSSTEKSTAESLARKVDGVKAVKNEIAVRP
jgi:hyperosmotically inducible periplasmic protein